MDALRGAHRTVTVYGRQFTVALRYHLDRLRYGATMKTSVYGMVRGVLRPETGQTGRICKTKVFSHVWGDTTTTERYVTGNKRATYSKLAIFC